MKILLVGYIAICLLLYFFQERLIFFPDQLPKDYQFSFSERFEEINIRTPDNKALNGLLFPAQKSKGLIFYLHGNAGSLNTWGDVAKTYTALNYDVFMLDYRGFGKSEGRIANQSQLFEDVQLAYDEMKKRYNESNIVVLGYSIGTGIAAYVAAVNQPNRLILQAPYYSLTDVMKKTYPLIPTFLLKYKLETNEYLGSCKMPIVIFHGAQDEVIYYGSSLKLKEKLKPTDSLITLNNQGHNGMADNPEYLAALQKILN